jgi:2-polyprenyl-6-methoxyphenol hydroxylase-like FAD-dependent oxidoreductase
MLHLKKERDPVLVVGCGPVGLAAGLSLAARGVPVRCVDRSAGPSPLSRALLVWPRTLAVLRSLCESESSIAERSMSVSSFRYYSSAREVARIGFTPHTRPVILPQPDIEWLLGMALRRSGAMAEWGTTLTGLAQHDDGVTAQLTSNGRTSTENFSYVVGCDGASSSVRELTGVTFDGATYPNTFLLADVMVDGPVRHDAVHYFCSPRGILVIIGLPGGRYRVFTSARPGLGNGSITIDTMQAMTDERGPGGLRLHDPSWISAFSVHARRASRYQVNRIFLAGDAAHAHSPAGGQGLNTGVTDAHNLCWKLALAWHGQANQSLLNSYEPERRQVAAAVLRQADLQTRAWLVHGRVRVAARDAAVRAASATRLFDRDYVPWLAGLRTVYSTDSNRVCDTAGVTRRRGRHPGRQAERMFVPGALIPRLRIRDAETGRQQDLEEALPHRRYTLLIVQRSSRPGGNNTILPDLCGLADIRALDADGTLREMPGRIEPVPALDSSQFVLIRPDHYVSAIGTAAIREYLDLRPRAEAIR